MGIQEPTDEQRAVIGADTTAVVAAGAGSGKTTVLAHRFVRLVLEKRAAVDEILTLTFTNKATNEMRQRIYTFLAAKREACEGAERALLDGAIANFYKARIETLDSYCASIVRAASSRYGLAPDFSEDMERSAAIIEEESLPFVIKYRNHPAITELYREKTPDVIARAVFAETISEYCFLGEPVDFVADFHAAAEKIAKDGDALAAKIQKILRALEDKQTALSGEMQKKNCAPLNIPDIDGCARERASRTDIVNVVKTLYDFAWTPLNKNPGRMLKDEFNALRERFALFVPLAVFIMQKEMMEMLCGLLNRFEKIVFDRKRREGSLSYADVASLARRILLENKELRREEKENFHSIIIDEFQDNNALQRDILYLLAEKHGAERDGAPDENNIIEGKLFFVGDEKQSIYKFRGADVSVFRDLQRRFPAGHFTLQTNFRSSHNLIGFFNAVFGGTDYSETKDKLPAPYPSVFARNVPSALPPYEAEYTPLQASEAKKKADGKAVVCLFPALNSWNKSEEEGEADEAEHAETEAVFVAKKIRELKESGRYQYRDMAILVRSHTNEHFFEKHLRIQGIPYTNENLNASVSIDPVADLYALLRLVAYPMDRLAYAEALRSPFVGLSFGGMLSALKAYDKSADKSAHNKNPIPFSDLASSLSEILSEEDRKKFDNGRNVYLETKNRSIHSSIQELIAHLWYAEGYRYEMLWHKETRAYYNGYHLLFALAVKADNAGASLAQFTETLKNLLESRRFFSGAGRDKSWLDDLIVPFEKEDALSLMTIHKSKGLEFPVVFVCGCGDGRKKTESAFVVKNEGVTVTPVFPLEFSSLDPKKVKKNYFRENAKDEENAKETAELRRLLYVAMTRAEKEIYLTGTLKYTRDDNDGENLETLVKSVAKRKMNKEEPRIEGDTIVDNGAFLGLLLPVIAERMDEGLFGLEEIPSAGREDLYGGSQAQSKRKEAFDNDAEGRGAFIAKARALYEKARIIEEEKACPRHQSVSYRKKCVVGDAADRYGHYEQRDALSGGDAADVFGKIDALLAGLHAEFGTITHTCVEAALKHKSASVPHLIAGKLDGGTAEQLLAAGEEIARRFLVSPLGAMAQNAAWIRSEFPFRTLERNAAVFTENAPLGGARRDVFINGTIDLVFEKDGIVTIVDFKTDNAENPAEHALQMAVYYRAARDLWQKETRVFLYYLRTGHAVEFEAD
ncbi:MAG: UvrD-helicase domain-containing protein [Spirochaetaceae bacterium]|jgi:ATP-dependent helicase/nuclease subunit A|nr:UvrD-helicase domain-containing protein [Spirochaetaceae bacterium]